MIYFATYLPISQDITSVICYSCTKKPRYSKHALEFVAYKSDQCDL